MIVQPANDNTVVATKGRVLRGILGAVLLPLLSVLPTAVSATPPAPGTTDAARAADKLMAREFQDVDVAGARALYLQACAQEDLRGCEQLLLNGYMTQGLSLAQLNSSAEKAFEILNNGCARSFEYDTTDYQFKGSCADWITFSNKWGRTEFKPPQMKEFHARFAETLVAKCLATEVRKAGEQELCDDAVNWTQLYAPNLSSKPRAHMCEHNYRCDGIPGMTLHLMQLSRVFEAGTTEAQAKKELEQFKVGIKNATCSNAESVAKGLGATVSTHTSLALDRLPSELRPHLRNAPAGAQTPVFGSVEDRMSVLILCGRR